MFFLNYEYFKSKFTIGEINFFVVNSQMGFLLNLKMKFQIVLNLCIFLFEEWMRNEDILMYLPHMYLLVFRRN